MSNILKSFAILFCIIGIAVSASVQNVPSPPPAAIVDEVTSTAATTPEFPTTTFPSTTVTQAATTKFDVPTTIQTPTTTSSPATTTNIEITITSPESTTISTTPEVKATDDLIRVCSCDEAKECDEKAYKKVDECKESCKSNLEYFGTSVDKYLTCFNDAVEESKKMTKCLQSNVNNFCVENPKESAFIPKQDYSIYYESYGVKEDTLEKTPELQKKAREIFIQQRKFQTCVIECLKKESVKCYENIGCAIGFPGKKDTAEILDSCPLFKTDLHMNALKQCQCLAFKQDVKKLYGKCAYVVSPYFMRKL